MIFVRGIPRFENRETWASGNSAGRCSLRSRRVPRPCRVFCDRAGTLTFTIRKNREDILAAVVFRHYVSGVEGVVEIESRKRERMRVVVGIGSQNPRPFGFAQGRLCVCKERRHKDGAPSGVEMSERVGQPPPR
ncbi:hypothetical protein SBA7_150005 [Candidatus Sulfotelmatobacter sp. SbA7]|nr:hypothetical protein SBA7_150005 [Candidatus Sulfotelmatobacter sp. SbA7]